MAQSDSSGGIGCLVLWVLLVGACVTGVGLYHSGWIPRSHDTPVWIGGDWLVGEYRTCDLLIAPPLARDVPSEQALGELPRLFCGRDDPTFLGSVTDFEFAMPVPEMTDALNAVKGEEGWSTFEGYFHVLPVRYYGRIDRTDRSIDSWRCQRESASLTCKALD